MSTIAEPIADASPVGVDLREDDSLRSLYYAIKDARSNARAEERSMLNGQRDGAPLRLPAQWAELRSLARTALTEHTKDIEILSWLIEAEARLGGVEGLADAFADAHALVVRFWDDLHSIDTDTVADKVAPLAGLNGSGAEGTLIQPLRFIPLVPGAPFYEFGLWTFQRAQRDADGEAKTRLRTEVDAAGLPAMTAHLAAVEAAGRAFADLTGALDAVCGDASPPSSNIRNTLAEIAAAVRSLAGLSSVEAPQPSVADVPHPAASASAENGAAAAAPPPVAANVIATREDAFGELLRIAAFFRRTEPHSPVSFAIETVVRRGRMDFVTLLDELVPDPGARQSVLTMAGIRPQAKE